MGESVVSVALHLVSQLRRIASRRQNVSRTLMATARPTERGLLRPGALPLPLRPTVLLCWGGEWKARTWMPAPLGDATTSWLPVKAATEAAVAASGLPASTKTFATADITAGITTAFAVGDRVTVSAASGNSCATNSCPICGTYHIAAINSNDVVFVESFTGDTTGGTAAHCELSRPEVTLSTLDNKQCCSCVPAVGSTVSAASLAVHSTETECTTDSAGARLGGTWTCSGVGPYCTTD